jgi:hypothetical protein
MSRKQLGDHADNSQKFICSASVKQNLLLLGSLLSKQPVLASILHFRNLYLGSVLSEALFLGLFEYFKALLEFK